MQDISLLDNYFDKFMHSLPLPDKTIVIDLDLLREMNLLHFFQDTMDDSSLTYYFHVVESQEKMTLVNEQFVIWIAPESWNGSPATITLIALNINKIPKLEIAFIASGVYNTSRLVLRMLEKFLVDIKENEKYLRSLEN